MDDLISRKAAINALTENKEMINAVLDSLTLDYNMRRNQEQRRGQINEDIETIKDLLSVQPMWKRGKWIDETFKPWGLVHHPYKCDQCGEHSEANSNFCPNCGADMRGDRN